jgi:hypothetical protein
MGIPTLNQIRATKALEEIEQEFKQEVSKNIIAKILNKGVEFIVGVEEETLSAITNDVKEMFNKSGWTVSWAIAGAESLPRQWKFVVKPTTL